MSGTQDQKRVNTHNTVVSVIHAASLITSLCVRLGCYNDNTCGGNLLCIAILL